MITGTILLWHRRIRLMKAMTAKLEGETKLYDITIHSPVNPMVKWTHRIVELIILWCTIWSSLLPIIQLCGTSKPRTVPVRSKHCLASPIGNQPAYPMSYPVLYNIPEGKSYSQEPGYVQGPVRSVFTESNGTETGIEQLSSNTVPHTPGPSIPQSPRST
jgi:hypothetical protein